MSIEPIPMYYEDEGGVYSSSIHQYTHRAHLDLDIDYVGDADTVGTYVFDVSHVDERFNALLFSRQLLLQEVAKRDFNILLLERYFDPVFLIRSLDIKL